MKRRRLLQSLAALPALPALPAAAQYSTSQPATAPEIPKLAETAPDAAADGVRRCFSEEQLAALRRLAELLVPKVGDRPGAVEADAVEFLDFLLKASNANRQVLYKGGLDHLNAEAQKLYQTPFAKVTDAGAKPILAPLTAPWTYAPPADPYARFLREVKEDLLQATVNSRAYAQVASRRRSGAGMNAYWLPLD